MGLVEEFGILAEFAILRDAVEAVRSELVADATYIAEKGSDAVTDPFLAALRARVGELARTRAALRRFLEENVDEKN